MKIQFDVKKADVLRACALLGSIDDNIIEIINKYEHETFPMADDDIADADDSKQMMLAFAYLIVAKILKAEGL